METRGSRSIAVTCLIVAMVLAWGLASCMSKPAPAPVAHEVQATPGGVSYEAIGLYNRLNVVNGGPNPAVNIVQNGTGPALSLPNGGDIVLGTDPTGGNEGARSEVIGLPRVAFVAFAAGTNGAAAGKTVVLMDDTPAGEFAAHDADTVCTTAADYSRAGAASLGLAVTTAADNGDGCHDPVGPLDFSADESIGMWIYATRELAAGDLHLDLTDDGGAQQLDVPALVPNRWTWVELALPAADGDKDVVSDISLELAAAGATKAAAGAFNVYADFLVKWDATEEEGVGFKTLHDGVLGVLAVATAAGSANTPSTLVLYTDYFVHYEASATFVVWISDQSANSTVAFVAY